jgi:deoxyguanosine kinase
MHATPFITVEGPIGVGKTSLAKKIAEEFQYQLLKEIVDENPFLGKFYEDIDRLHLQNGAPVVSDYHIMKNLIFAKRTLRDKQYGKYLQIYDILTSDMPKPNVIIYLHASLDTLLSRIEMRGRDIEKKIDPLYLQQLSLDYDEEMDRLEQQYPSLPILRFNGDEIDFIQREADKQKIFNQLRDTLKKGVII